MEILEMWSYKGRNIFSHKPVIRMILELGSLANVLTAEIEGFNEHLLQWFPGLNSHYCCIGHEGGFVQRLQEGTLPSHVIEHLALELQCIAGYDVYYGKTRNFEEPSKYCLVYEYINEQCGMDCGRAAVEIVSALARREDVPIEEILHELRTTAANTGLGPSTQAIWNEARRRNIPVARVGENSLLQLGYGKHLRFIEASLLDNTSCIAVEMAKDKELTKKVLKQHNIPTPEGYTVYSQNEAIKTAEELGYPVAIKPFDGNQGKGVTTNIRNKRCLLEAYNLARKYAEQVMVEKCIQGKDYRVLVVGEKVSAVAERKPPYVVGDGLHSIEELVMAENRNPNRGEGHEKPLTKIKLDSVALRLLTDSGLNEEYIPGVGEIVYLRENGNLSTGGSARDCTKQAHPVNKILAVRAARAVGLEIAGVDIVMDDISKPLTSKNGAVIEVNAAPGLRMHLFPTEGQARNVAADILEYMYPQGTPVSIPVISITGTNGKTTVTRIVHHTLSISGKKVGMACSSGTYIGNECVAGGDHTGPASAQAVLYNKEVEVAVLETARGGIIRKGLGYDLADIGVITNLSEDHLGLDGINTLEDLAFVKALVVEAVKPHGYAVLNADDRMSGYLADRVRCNLIYFSRQTGNQIIERHIDQGKMAVLVENGQVIVYRNNKKIPIVRVSSIPITYNGRIACNIENSLAAVAALAGLNIPEQVIRMGLTSFKPDTFANPGRFNLFDMGDFQVLLDYAHNIKGYESVIQFINNLQASRLVGVIGVPGDRMNSSVYGIGKIAGQAFNRLYIKEDEDLRGRSTGEIADLLYKGALLGGARKENIEIILSETEALSTAIRNALPGDLVVMFYENFEKALEVVQKYAPVPLLSLEKVAVPATGQYYNAEAIH